MKSLGRIALVTGGMGGIGTAISQRLYKEGFKVIVGCSSDSARKKEWMASQLEAGFQFECIYGDISDWESTRKAFEMAVSNSARSMCWLTTPASRVMRPFAS
jgi:Dehydrogenases with different specificities (related to short-chain alcohol dehydrogenases)